MSRHRQNSLYFPAPTFIIRTMTPLQNLPHSPTLQIVQINLPIFTPGNNRRSSRVGHRKIGKNTVFCIGVSVYSSPVGFGASCSGSFFYVVVDGVQGGVWIFESIGT